MIKDYFSHGGTRLYVKKTRLGCAMGFIDYRLAQIDTDLEPVARIIKD